MCRSMVDVLFATVEIRRGKEEEEEEEEEEEIRKKKPQGKNIMPASAIRRAAIIKLQ